MLASMRRIFWTNRRFSREDSTALVMSITSASLPVGEGLGISWSKVRVSEAETLADTNAETMANMCIHLRPHM